MTRAKTNLLTVTALLILVTASPACVRPLGPPPRLSFGGAFGGMSDGLDQWVGESMAAWLSVQLFADELTCASDEALRNAAGERVTFTAEALRAAKGIRIRECRELLGFYSHSQLVAGYPPIEQALPSLTCADGLEEAAELLTSELSELARRATGDVHYVTAYLKQPVHDGYVLFSVGCAVHLASDGAVVVDCVEVLSERIAGCDGLGQTSGQQQDQSSAAHGVQSAAPATQPTDAALARFCGEYLRSDGHEIERLTVSARGTYLIVQEEWDGGVWLTGGKVGIDGLTLTFDPTMYPLGPKPPPSEYRLCVHGKRRYLVPPYDIRQFKRWARTASERSYPPYPYFFENLGDE